MLLLRVVGATISLALAAPTFPVTRPMTAERLIELLPADAPTQPDMVFQNYPLVHRVDCEHSRGTAFRVGGPHWLSVAHVTDSVCAVEGHPLQMVEQDGAHDFSRFDTPDAVPNGFAIDCDGFRPGHWYWAVGHALGAPFQTAVAIYATIYRSDLNGQRIFVGVRTVIPGMSGGPVLDPETGKVVGTVNAYNAEDHLSFSRELRDTSLCPK